MRYRERLLENVELFRGLAEGDLRVLEASGATQSFEAGSVIFAEGDHAEQAYAVLRGEVAISRRDEGSQQSVDIATIGAGDVFGELALFDGAPRSATATARGPVSLFALRRDAFFAFLAASPHSIARLFSRLSAKIRASNERLLTESLEKERVRTELERARFRSLAELVAGIAHEINTPLGIIRTATSVITETLATAGEEDRFADLLEAGALIDANLARVNKLVQSFKNLSASQMVDELEETDLVEAVDETVTLFKPVARRAQLEIEVAAAQPHMPWTGYRGFLSQILLNLLTNIERYAYTAGGRVQIRINSRDDGHYEIAVRDFGAGMSAGDVGRVFEPFFTTGRARGGTGLGMAIVHNLVTRGLSGEIAVTSEPGAGTAVTISFPKQVPRMLAPP